jgi:hypothetical protein
MALSFHHPTTDSLLFGHLPDSDMMTSFLQDPEVTDALLGFVYDPLDVPANAALDDLLLNLPLCGDDSDDGEVVGQQQHCAKRQRGCGDAAWCGGLADIDAAAGKRLRDGGGNQQLVPELLDEFFVLPLPPLPPPPPPPLPPPQQQQLLPAPVASADARKAAAAGNVSQSVQSAAARQRRKRISEKTAELSRLIPGGHKMNTAEMLEAAARHVKLLRAQVGMLALLRTVASTEVVTYCNR